MSTIRFIKLTRIARNAVALAAFTVAALPHAGAYGVPGQGTWETTLQGRDLDGNVTNGFEAYYDTTLNISWLADPYASGQLNWADAKAWVSNLNVNGVTGWRLPSVSPVPGFSGNLAPNSDLYMPPTEFTHLYFVTLGNKIPLNRWGYPEFRMGDYFIDWLTNAGPFWNLRTYGPGGNYFWYNEAYDDQALSAHSFQLRYGTTDGGNPFDSPNNGSWNTMSAWAVHAGDVGVAANVPEPESMVLALAGLAVAGTLTRKRRV